MPLCMEIATPGKYDENFKEVLVSHYSIDKNFEQITSRGEALSLSDLIQSNIETLESGAAIFNDLTDAQYTQILSPYFSASIGKHFRHILDHYFCFFAGLEKGHINYDHRDRNPAIETQRLYTRQKISELTGQLRELARQLIHLPENASQRPLQVSLASSPNRSCNAPATSSLSRELTFLQGHTTHHYALISTQLKLMECPVDENFGVAASTQIYNRQQSCAQ